MKIEKLPVKEIFPYENNPRINDNAVEKIAKSIERFGWTQPIVVDENRVIIAGHTRHKAAIMLGMDTVPVYVATGLKPEEVKALRIADNRLATEASWDMKLLNQEVESLLNVNFDMDMLGFNQEEFNGMFPELFGVEDDFKEPDEEKEHKKEFLVLIECMHENEQKKVYEEMMGKGYHCKMVV